MRFLRKSGEHYPRPYLSLLELKYLPSKTRTGILENQEPITRLQKKYDVYMRD